MDQSLADAELAAQSAAKAAESAARVVRLRKVYNGVRMKLVERMEHEDAILIVDDIAAEESESFLNDGREDLSEPVNNFREPGMEWLMATELDISEVLAGFVDETI
jgi:hypothetical protein